MDEERAEERERELLLLRELRRRQGLEWESWGEPREPEDCYFGWHETESWGQLFNPAYGTEVSG